MQQNQQLLAQAEQRRQQELAAAEERRATEARRFEDLLTADKAETERQRQASDTQALEERQRRDTEAASERQRFETLLSDQRAYQEQVAAQIRAAEEAQAQREAQAAAQLESQRAAERAAVEQAARERADRTQQYSTGRQSLIDAFTGDVNEAYSGFNDQFYDQFRGDFISAEQPELERQYQDENRGLVYAFTNSGNLDSTAAARKFGELERLRVARQGRLAEAADDTTLSLRNSIDQERRDALAAAFSSGAVGREDLPDDVTDVGGALGSISSQLSGLRGDVRNRATQPRTTSFVNLDSLMADLNLDTSRLPGAYPAFGRFGGTNVQPRGSSPRASYLVN